MNEEAENNKEGTSKEENGRFNRDVSRKNADDVLTKYINSNAQHDILKLRPYLTGKILFQITDKESSYVFDWSTDKVRTELVSSPEKELNIDCYISLSEDTLLKIVSGDINPQIAMLSTKINVKGKIALAVYAFNLLAN